MVQHNTARLGTAFTVPVDHVDAKTGITAPEKAMAIRALADPETKPTDFARPGHIFPLEAKEGGVLRRAGHTETAVDLCRLAGLFPAGLLTEILDDTGDRAKRDTLIKMANEFKLKIITVEELIKYRRQREKIVERVADANLPTKYGLGRIYAYRIKYETGEPIAIVYGDLSLDTENCLLTCKTTGKSIQISAKEYQMMEYMMKRGGKKITKEDFLDKIWGVTSDAEYNSVEVYISFLRKKLRFLGTEASIKAIRGVGYKLAATDDE